MYLPFTLIQACVCVCVVCGVWCVCVCVYVVCIPVCLPQCITMLSLSICLPLSLFAILIYTLSHIHKTHIHSETHIIHYRWPDPACLLNIQLVQRSSAFLSLFAASHSCSHPEAERKIIIRSFYSGHSVSED